MRFRAEQHLRRPGEIRAVRERGRRIDCPAFTVWWKHRADAAGEAALTGASAAPLSSPLRAPRVCVIASTAAVGNAIRRNRAKRRLRELFRNQQMAVPAGCDLLLIARRAAVERSMPELQAMFAAACKRIPAEGTS